MLPTAAAAKEWERLCFVARADNARMRAEADDARRILLEGRPASRLELPALAELRMQQLRLNRDAVQRLSEESVRIRESHHRLVKAIRDRLGDCPLARDLFDAAREPVSEVLALGTKPGGA